MIYNLKSKTFLPLKSSNKRR